MLDPINSKGSIIDQIREDLKLDSYYRKFENRRFHDDIDYYDDPQVDFDYEFEFAD